MYTRRNFIKTTSVPAAIVLGSSVLPYRSAAGNVELTDEVRIKKIVDAAIDSAIAAGAQYADIRLSHNYEVRTGSRFLDAFQGENMSIGVRALIDGCWGFAASTLWNEPEAIRIGREASRQAKSIAQINRRTVVLPVVEIAKNEKWIMEVDIDPFTIDPQEIRKHSIALLDYASNYMDFRGARFDPVVSKCLFIGLKKEKVFGSSEGAFCQQTNYLTGGEFVLGLSSKKGRKIAVTTDLLTYSSVGLERFFSPQIRDSIKKIVDGMILDADLETKPIDVGRHNIIMDSQSVSDLVSQTIGLSTEYDRVMGSEANAGGTSYLNDSDDMFGLFKIGNNLLNVNGNRSEQGGAATVKWDDEGVVPQEFSIVSNGIWSGSSTDREWASQSGGKLIPNGCCSTGSEPQKFLAGGGAINIPLVQTPNLIMKGSDSSDNFDDLVKNMDNGIVFKGIRFLMDFQQLNGLGGGEGNAYQVKNGKIVARFANAGILIRAPEFWNSITALGGKSTVVRTGHAITKGEPSQGFYHSVTTPAVAFKDSTVIDISRRA